MTAHVLIVVPSQKLSCKAILVLNCCTSQISCLITFMRVEGFLRGCVFLLCMEKGLPFCSDSLYKF